MKNKELSQLRQDLDSLRDLIHPKNNKFSNALSVTRKNVNTAIDTITANFPKPTGELIDALEKDLVAVDLKHYIKNEEGKVRLFGGEPKIENMELYQKEIADTKLKHADATILIETYNEEFSKALDQTATVIFHRVKWDDLPGMSERKLEIVKKYMLCQ